ncbi:MAG: hypothetical protein LC768_11365 [Acidobacteria bacterium]|nr:hypothetical protein [Acidobacteriota bacterium]MCA1638910.1 hypothetical protein [Acidobacteriota bacterium]
MKKFIVGFLFLLVTTVSGILAFNFFEMPSDVFVSPSGKYRVELYGNKERPWLPFSENPMTAKVYSNGEMLASPTIHTSYWLENSFEQKYQKYIWTDDKILSFRRIQNHEVANDKNGDSLLISNKTDRDIRFLKIVFSVNMFLVFELAPHSSQTVYINHSKAPEYIYAMGEFTNGEKIRFKGVNFPEQAKKGKTELFKYCASVENNGVSINSIQIEGYETNPKVIVPIVGNCSQ